MAKLGKKDSDSKKIEGAPNTIKNRSKDKKYRIMINPEYKDGKSQKEVYISDIGEWVDARAEKEVYMPESTYNWLRKQGEYRERYEKKGDRIKKTGEYYFVPRFKIFK